MAQLYCASLPLVVNIYFTGTTVSRTKFYLAQRFLSGKRSVYYTESETRTDEPSNYQELNISRDEIAYQNTTLH